MVGKTNSSTNPHHGHSNPRRRSRRDSGISLPAPKANLTKELDKTPIYEQSCLVAQLHAFLLQDSPDITQLNFSKIKAVLRIINIPKSSMIRVLHFFGVGTNPIGGSSPIAGKILSLVDDGSSANPPQAMVIPREVIHKTSIWVTDQDSCEHKLNNTQASPLLKNANFTQEAIILKIMPISAFLVYNGFDVDLYAITIYRHTKTLPDLSEPAVQTLLTFLCGCMTSRLVNDTVTFIPSSVFMESTPPAARTWGLNKFNITFPTLCSSHHETGPASASPVSLSDINLKLFQHFL